MFKLNSILKILSTSCLAAMIVACGGQTETSLSKDTLVVANGADAKTLDPHATNDQPSSRVFSQLYSNLVETNREMAIVPALAESWEHIDDRTTVFNLRKGVKFHNGEELKASDVRFTLERMKNSPTVAHIIGAVETIEVVDEYTVKITTSEPFGPLLYHLAHNASAILNEKAVTDAGQDYGQQPVGTGPYRFVEWVVGDRVSMAANEDYYDGKPVIENAVFRSIVEGTNRAIALETGEVDIAYDIEPIDVSVITGNDGLTLVEEESLSVAFFGFNTNKAPFDNVKIRQAIAYAVSADDIVESVALGAGVAANSPIGPKVFGHNPDAKFYSQDFEKARQLMAEAGYPDGFRTTVWTNDNPLRVQIAQIMQAQVRQIGIDMSIEVLEWGAYLDGTSRGEHDIYILGWFTLTGDADYGLYPLYSSSTHGGAGNRGFYTNPKVDQLLHRARTSTDSEERRGLYAEIQEILQEDVPIVNLYWQFQNVGLNNSVDHFEMAPTGVHRIRDVTFKEAT